jgi:hypothetical protein
MPWQQRSRPKRDWRQSGLSRDERLYRQRRFFARRRDYFAYDDTRRIEEFGGPRECKARERLFVASFIARLEDAIRTGARVGKRALARAAVTDGFDVKGRAIETKADELMEMPRIQRAIAEQLDKQGVNIEMAGAVLAGVMTTGEPGDRLRAVELFFKVTTGFAVTKTATTHKTERTDKFFSPDKFDRPGAPKRVGPVTIDQE